MTRLNVFLLLILLVSSLYLVRVSYESRRLFAELDKAQNEERALDTDSERLKTELRSLGRIKPGPTEATTNPRARSAVMRVAERTDVPLGEGAAA